LRNPLKRSLSEWLVAQLLAKQPYAIISSGRWPSIAILKLKLLVLIPFTKVHPCCLDVDKTQINIAEYNFDHPNALDFDLAYKTLTNLIESSERV
jgi:hypothetical protein